MTQVHRDNLQQNLKEVAQDIVMDSILNHLRESEILTAYDVQAIQSQTERMNHSRRRKRSSPTKRSASVLLPGAHPYRERCAKEDEAFIYSEALLLFRILGQKPDTAYTEFINGLRITNQGSIADILEPPETGIYCSNQFVFHISFYTYEMLIYFSGYYN